MQKIAKRATYPETPTSSRKILNVRLFLPSNPLAKYIYIFIGSSMLFAFYIVTSRTTLHNSDNANALLEAQSVLHGNILLRGWYLPTDSFISIDILFNVAGLLLGFPITSLLYIVPSLFYTLIILCSGYLLSTFLTEKQRIWGWLALFAVAAFPPFDMLETLFMSPIHIGTVLFILIGLIAYKHFLSGARGNWVAFAIVMLMVVLTVVGDPFVLVLFVLPLLLAEGIQMLLRMRISLRENAVFFGTLLAAGIARGITSLLRALGTHILNNISFQLTDLPGMIVNLRDAMVFVYQIFHGDIFDGVSLSLSTMPTFINAAVVTVFALALVCAIIIRSKYSLFQAKTTATTTKVIQVATWSTLGTLAAFIISTLGGAIRYLYPILFLSELATFPVIFSFVNKHVLRVAILLVLVVNALPFALYVYHTPRAVPDETQLLAVLKEHHLTQGLGTYWVSSIVTVESREQVTIRQITIINGQIHPYYFFMDGSWFNAANLREANFLVSSSSERSHDIASVYYDSSVRSFGVPDHKYQVGSFTILAWNTPLLTHTKAGYSLT